MGVVAFGVDALMSAAGSSSPTHLAVFGTWYSSYPLFLEIILYCGIVISNPVPWDQSSFIPVGRPDTLSVEQFTTLGHPAFPAYSVRIKRADPTAFTCDPTVKVLSDGGPLFSPFSRNSNASVFFVDQPIGVGFSYADYDEIVNSKTAAFTWLESYGGRYLPVFASEVYDQNARLVEIRGLLVRPSILIEVSAVIRYIKEYLDNPEIRAAINVSSSIGKFNCCSDDVSAAFTSMMDENHPSDSYVAELLEREVRVLVYVGTCDWICN
ncbi:protease S10 [Pisolithus thermaeus]|nr:protease S10 [Pisolithus thermaeus]